MNIGVDALSLGSKPGSSLAVYIVNVVREMAKLTQEHSYFVFLPRDSVSLFSNLTANVELIPVVESNSMSVRRLLTEHITLSVQAVRLGIDVMFGPMHILPLLHSALGGCDVVNICDLRFLDRPQDFSLFNRLYRRLFYRLSAQTARAILTISDFSRDRVLHHWGIDPDKVTTVCIASDRIGPEPASEHDILAIRRKYGISDSFILTGASQPHKNAERVMDAFALMEPSIRESYMVVAFGAGESYLERLSDKRQRMGLDERVILLGYVPDEDVTLLHQAASAFVSLSHYEGFGLSVLDSMAAGVPVICSNVGSHSELVEHEVNGLLVDPNDLESVTAALSNVLTDVALRQQLCAAARSSLSRFAWKITAYQTLRVLEACGRRHD